ncbi:MAG: hypothetical protein XD93_0810 [candidate division WS6 bacterium 34_10]|uniref:Transmembrane(S)protein n=1 Tax=candidate division WS6 bacterium 34_10 TaxID=1641389 RepID=A0A124FX15_9BACT|nr:MAG: hypothetical protein XD93_0810 [candidate division WS6 bacterium 34_10]
MNIFIDIYKNWTLYEWIFLGSSVILVLLSINLATYYFTKKWKLNLTITLTYIAPALIYILSIFGLQFVPVTISHISLIPVLLIIVLISINWITLISYYFKHKDRKSFSLLELIKEHKRDSIRNIVFLTITILSVSIFLRGELLILFIITYLSSSISIYLSTFLLKKFIND